MDKRNAKVSADRKKVFAKIRASYSHLLDDQTKKIAIVRMPEGRTKGYLMMLSADQIEYRVSKQRGYSVEILDFENSRVARNGMNTFESPTMFLSIIRTVLSDIEMHKSTVVGI